ncbi:MULTISPECIES: maleylpyruvate isomerase family mycothiol-dependent enzyme [unclassified Ornithinimicrobium]|uniref:maleylpyruvate isomerase family mycothiol-dependent enzyme n=1 Tax=unclassified Ornithinimicrobium TaxID=2615080 RepID=UPI003853E643
MAPPLERSRAWMAQGTTVLDQALAGTEDDTLLGPTRLAGWTGRHLLAHLAANADALRNLAAWARTGVETPMYSSPEQRNADIEAGAVRPVGELREWYAVSAAALAADLDGLDERQWQHPVRTAQGRTVAATEVPWMRAREVMVHAVDLGTGVQFTDLPEGFLHDLLDDVVPKRSSTPDHPPLTLREEAGGRTWQVASPGPDAPEVTGTAAQLAAYVSGRADGSALVTADGAPSPTLPPWL